MPTSNIVSPKRKIYISGPMRGLPEFNFPAFFAAAWRLSCGNWRVYNPAQNDINCGVDVTGTNGTEELKNFNLRKAMSWDCEAVCMCDAIYMLAGWSESEGAKLELALAEMIGLEVIYQRES